MTRLLNLLGGTKRSGKEVYQMKGAVARKENGKFLQGEYKTINQIRDGLIEVIARHNEKKDHCLINISTVHKNNFHRLVLMVLTVMISILQQAMHRL